MTSGCFRLWGNFDPDEITRELDIEPSLVVRIGDPAPTGKAATSAVWCLVAKEESAGDVADQIIELVVPLREKAEVIAKMSARYDGIIEVVSFRDDLQKEWFLSSEVLRDLARLALPLRCVNITMAQHEAHKEWLRAN